MLIACCVVWLAFGCRTPRNEVARLPIKHSVRTEQLQIIQERILSRDKLLEMANDLQIYAPAPGKTATTMSGDAIVEDLRNRVVINVSGGGNRGQAQATLVSVSFSAPTAEMSAAVTNRVVTMILEEDVAMRTSVARQTLDFFVQEVARLDQELAKSKAAIVDFQELNRTAMPDSLTFRRSQQVLEQQRLAQMEIDEAAVSLTYEAGGWKHSFCIMRTACGIRTVTFGMTLGWTPQ